MSLRITCLCGCGLWAYHERKGPPPHFFTQDCLERALARGIAEKVKRRGRVYRLTAKGKAAKLARQVRYICECGDVAQGPKKPCVRCDRLETLRYALAPRETRDTNMTSDDLYVFRRRLRQRRQGCAA